MNKFVYLAQSLNPNFWIAHYISVPLVVQYYDSCEPIVLPSFGGFWILTFEEYHGSSLSGHLGTHKIL